MAKKNSIELQDDEFRVIGKPSAPEVDSKAKSRNLWISILSLILVAGIGAIIILKWPKEVPENPNDGIFENNPEVVIQGSKPTPLGSQTDKSYTEKIDTIINDVILSLYIPHNATPELTLGVPDRADKSIIFAAQAADIRKDNRKILGAFVLKGEPLAWGLSKKGFCAIIDSVVTVGVSENSPLFEEATEKDGYFFRQFPLVDNGTLVENEPKNKTMRKALCSRAGQIFVAVSESDESFHDFSQALIDLGVENAIYLVGSHSSFGWFIDANGTKTLFAPDVHRGTYKNENYIIWR
ncbi:MAG: hypothetical protein IJM35_09945 [Bacteroidales bacterium]|nr:hypothetical protein [Bacteroidales bacterium]